MSSEEKAKESISFNSLAKKTLDVEEYKKWGIASPVSIRNLSLKKDDHKKEKQELPRVPTVASAIIGSWLATKLGLNGKDPVKQEDDGNVNPFVFSNVNMVLLPGEMTLVLGPSSSGKTTLMRTLAQVLSGEKTPSNDDTNTLQGTMAISGKPPTNQSNRMVCFVDQGDLSLTPILTVYETFKFALDCADTIPSSEIDDHITNILKLLGLDHVANTVVGNADIRGVSGGQKRRVKLLEQAVGSNIRWSFLDEITNGLDAASAYNICYVLRTAAECLGITEIVALLQPSNDVYNLFHRIVLLSQDGKVVFSGKREHAVSHFLSLGFSKPDDMNDSEFLLRCISSPEDFLQQNKSILNSSRHENDGDDNIELFVDDKEDNSHLTDVKYLSDIFMDTQAGKSLDEELKEAETEPQSVKESKKVSEFEKPFYKQIQIVTKRCLTLMLRNPSSLVRIISAIIFGIFIGTLFLNTPSTTSGTSIKSGYALTMIFLIFLTSCMSNLEDLFHDRLTFYVHRSSNFYCTTSYYISQVISALPVGIVESIFLSTLSYFAVGMNNITNNGAGYFYFTLLCVLLNITGNAICRLLAFTLPSADIANSLGPAVLLFFVLTGGFSPQYSQIPAFMRWISWLSPCAYCYEGMIVNEIYNRDVEIDDGENKGTISGNDYGTIAFGIPRVGYDTAPAGLNTPVGIMFFDAYMLICLALFFDILACLALHKSQKWYGPSTKRYQVVCGQSLSVPPSYSTTFKRKKDNSVDNTVKMNNDIPEAPKVHLTARCIVYEVDVDIPKEDDEKKVDNEDDNVVTSKFTINDENTDEEEEHYPSTTIQEYGQKNRGAAQEWVLKRRIGEDCLSISKNQSSTSKANVADAAENGYLEELDPPAPGRLRLLSGITASFEPGTMTALMGSSGAGKSTLLDVLAGYKTGGYITGDININNIPKTNKTWRSIAGYCEQVDLHNPALTVRESLLFAARMRLRPFTLSEEAKLSHVENILELLELNDVADMLVGNEAIGEGLPKHARKRLTVGVELAANPSILFADEPTSGLDSLSASVVVGCLERAAQIKGLTVVCTIHQPSKEVFEAFDNLLLLRKGGVCVYNGPITNVESYMAQATNNHTDYVLPLGANPADFALDIFCGAKGEREDWGKLYKSSSMAKGMEETFASSTCNYCEDGDEKGGLNVDTNMLGFGSELWLVMSRQLLAHWRTPTYMAVRFWWTILASVVTGIVYLGQGKVRTPENLLNIIGAIFFYVNIATVPLLAAAVPLITERAIYYRETSSGTYRPFIYGISVQIAELPFNIGAALISCAIFYPLVGLSSNVESIIYFILMGCATYWLLPALGQLLAFCSPNIGAAVGSGSLVLTFFTLTMGFMIPGDKIPPWYIWMYWINPLRYMLQGLVVSDIGSDPLGDEILNDAMGWSYNDRWWYCFVAVLFFAVLASGGVLAATRISWLQR